jgi:hypothetical protein
MRMTDRERVGVAFSVLADGLAGPVDRVMRKAFGGQEVGHLRRYWGAVRLSRPSRGPRMG